MNSLEVKEFEQAIISFVNENKIPDEVKRIILENILYQQEKMALESIKKEIKERENTDKNKNKV